MNFLDLFSGIGGFAYATQLAGLTFQHHYYSEIEDYAIKVYRKNFPQAQPAGDIRRLDTSKLPQGDWFVTGGFPCQDISEAGRQQGLSGQRSGLWWDMHRVLRDLQPRAAIIENVSALRYKGLDRVLCGLAEIGYDAEWEVITAASVGAPHVRERLWIVAYPDSHRQPAEPHTQHPPMEGRQTTRADMANEQQPNDPVEGNDTWVNWKAITASGEILREPILCRVHDGFNGGVEQARLKALGNSIVPQVAAQIMRKMQQAGYITT